MLNSAIPFGSRVLEIGCGTGQLSNFLGIATRQVLGTDICVNSLRLAEEFRRQHGLVRTCFLQMNLFRPGLRPGRFDVILCNGVLHHTSDPEGGLSRLVPLLRPGGHIVIGLYNRWGRLMTDSRRSIFRLTRGRGRWLEPYLRGTSLSSDRKRAWFADRYCHPHESKHTIGEVLRWFDTCGLDFVRGVPATTLDEVPLTGDGLFDEQPAGDGLDHFLTRAVQVVTGSREGGFFLMIGRRRASSAS